MFVKYLWKIYRFDDWIKTFGITLLGLMLAKVVLNPITFLFGILQSLLLFAFVFVFDDFNDFFVEKHHTFIGNLLKKKIISFRQSLVLVLLPLFVSFIVSLIFFSEKYFIIYILFLFFAITYSAPKIRMDDKPFIDLVYNILIFTLLFLQSIFFVQNNFSDADLIFLIWIGGYILSTELIHQLSHRKNDATSTAKFLGVPRTILCAQLSFLLMAIVGIFLFFKFPNLRIFTIGISIFSFARFLYSRRFSSKTDFGKMRNMWGWFEGLVYLVIVFIQAI